MEATIAAFTKGEPWLNELTQYLAENKRVVLDFINEKLPEIKVVNSDATYLLWIDCSKVTEDAEELCNYIRSNTGLYVSSGAVYGGNGKTFIRMNIACPRIRLEDGLSRFEAGIKSYIENKSQYNQG